MTLEIGDEIEETQTTGKLGPDDGETAIFGRVTGKLENDHYEVSVSIKDGCISETLFVRFCNNTNNYSDNSGWRAIQPGSNASGTTKPIEIGNKDSQLTELKNRDGNGGLRV